MGQLIQEKYTPRVPYYFKSTPVGKLPASDTEAHIDEIEKKEPLIICRLCRNIITSTDAMIDINGSHSHVFENPSGIVYRIGCFATARGCITMGEPTKEFTWFSGFSWCVAICSYCLTHLGWLYESGKTSFYGLILDNIMENL